MDFFTLPLWSPSFLRAGCAELAGKHWTRAGSQPCKGLLAELPNGLTETVAPAMESLQDVC